MVFPTAVATSRDSDPSASEVAVWTSRICLFYRLMVSLPERNWGKGIDSRGNLRLDANKQTVDSVFLAVKPGHVLLK